MKIHKLLRLLSFSVLVVSLLSLTTACQGAQVENLQGLLQAVDGKEMVVKLDDGTVARITVEDSKSASEAEDLIGKQVEVEVRVEKGERQLSKIENRAEMEDQTISGTIESISAQMAKINGQDFKITANTVLDGGLIAGAAARVEFITLADGTRLATEIETDKGITRGRGRLDSISDDTVVIDGKVFHMDDNSRRQSDLASGQNVHVEFGDDNGVRHINEIETETENFHFTGTIQSMTADSITVDGRTFKINPATILDSGLVVGATARLEFIDMANGDQIATEIENDENEIEIENENENEVENENEGPDDNSGGGGNSGSGGGN